MVPTAETESLPPLLASHPASSSGELSPGVPKIAVAYTHRHVHDCPSGSPQVVSPEEKAMLDSSPPSRLAGWTAALATQGSELAAAQSQGLQHRVGLSSLGMTSCSPKGPPNQTRHPSPGIETGIRTLSPAACQRASEPSNWIILRTLMLLSRALGAGFAQQAPSRGSQSEAGRHQTSFLVAGAGAGARLPDFQPSSSKSLTSNLPHVLSIKMASPSSSGDNQFLTVRYSVYFLRSRKFWIH